MQFGSWVNALVVIGSSNTRVRIVSLLAVGSMLEIVVVIINIIVIIIVITVILSGRTYVQIL
jgi:hypothetical protein